MADVKVSVRNHLSCPLHSYYHLTIASPVSLLLLVQLGSIFSPDKVFMDFVCTIRL